jgi:hypothetical protein
MSVPPCDVDQGLASDTARTQWRELARVANSVRFATHTLAYAPTHRRNGGSARSRTMFVLAAWAVR